MPDNFKKVVGDTPDPGLIFSFGQDRVASNRLTLVKGSGTHIFAYYHSAVAQQPHMVAKFDLNDSTLPNDATTSGRVVNSSELLQQQFEALIAEWKDATSHSSSITDICGHPAYLRIIGMGKDAVPFILKELKKERDHWFVALAAISGDNPVPDEARGRMKLMAAAWLDWGKRQGHVE